MNSQTIGIGGWSIVLTQEGDRPQITCSKEGQEPQVYGIKFIGPGGPDLAKLDSFDFIVRTMLGFGTGDSTQLQGWLRANIVQ